MSFDIGRWRAREWFVLGCTVLVLLVSPSDWYGISVRDAANPSSPWRDLVAVNAWSASTAWTLAVGATAFAAALWLVHRGQAAQPAWVRRTAAAIVLAALGAIGWQYVAMGEVDQATATAGSTVQQVGVNVARVSGTAADSSPVVVQLPPEPRPSVDRDDLVAGSGAGHRAGARWGMTAATALLTVLLLTLLTTPATGQPTLTPTDPNPSGPEPRRENTDADPPGPAA